MNITKNIIILKKYINDQNLVTSGLVDIVTNAKYVFVIPVFNEEKNISYTIDSIVGTILYSKISANIIIGNNMSTDKTLNVIERLKDKYRSILKICVINTKIPGCGPTRKKIMDEVVLQHYKNCPNLLQYMILMDGDTVVPKNFLFEIEKVILKSKPSIVTNVYKYPLWLDTSIYKHIGISNYTGRASDMLVALSRQGCAILRTNGVNTAINVVTYSKLGGVDLVNNFHSTDTYLGERALMLNETIAFHDAITYTSPRRFFESTISGLSIDESFTKLPYDHKLTDLELYNKFVELYDSKNVWLDKRELNELYLFNRYGLVPFLRGYVKANCIRDLLFDAISKKQASLLYDNIIKFKNNCNFLNDSQRVLNEASRFINIELFRSMLKSLNL